MQRQPRCFVYCVLFKFIYFEREAVHEEEGQRDRERERIPSKSPTRGSIPRTTGS